MLIMMNKLAIHLPALFTRDLLSPPASPALLADGARTAEAVRDTDASRDAARLLAAAATSDRVAAAAAARVADTAAARTAEAVLACCCCFCCWLLFLLSAAVCFPAFATILYNYYRLTDQPTNS